MRVPARCLTARKPRLPRALRQRGQALLLALLVLGVAGGAVLFSYYRSSTLTLESEQKTTDALALVKTALIGWSVKRGDIGGNKRPGEFPCPDRDNDGFDNDGNCSPGQLGRVPWKTLGIPEPKDSAGETLWYAVARPFQTRGSNVNPLNSDTRGDMAVYAADGTTVLTSQAVAVIIAPGRALGTQTRSGANQNIAANYLETSATRNNSTNNGPFINGQLSATYNDRVVYLTTPEFMPSVEKRVGTEVKAWLDGYRAATEAGCKCYPWAASFNITIGTGTPPLSANFPNQSVPGVNRGRFPFSPAKPVDWGGAQPVLSSWFTYNNWHTVIYYAIAKQNTEGRGASCTTCTPSMTLSVDGKAVISAIFFTPGTPLTGITRPSNNLTDYLEDRPLPNNLVPPSNNDGLDDIYLTPTATALDRDRIYTSISAPAAIDTGDTVQQCEDMGKALRNLTPCGQPPKLNSQCASLAGTDSNGTVLIPAQGLQVCSPACANAARVVVNVPCQNTTKPSVCRDARDTLKDDC